MTALPLRIAVALSVDTAHIASSALVLAMHIAGAHHPRRSMTQQGPQRRRAPAV